MRRAEPEDPTGDQLTDRQRRIMQVIEESVRRHGYPPTLREIGDAAGRGQHVQRQPSADKPPEEGLRQPRRGPPPARR